MRTVLPTIERGPSARRTKYVILTFSLSSFMSGGRPITSDLRRRATSPVPHALLSWTGESSRQLRCQLFNQLRCSQLIFCSPISFFGCCMMALIVMIFSSTTLTALPANCAASSTTSSACSRPFAGHTPPPNFGFFIKSAIFGYRSERGFIPKRFQKSIKIYEI